MNAFTMFFLFLRFIRHVAALRVKGSVFHRQHVSVEDCCTHVYLILSYLIIELIKNSARRDSTRAALAPDLFNFP